MHSYFIRYSATFIKYLVGLGVLDTLPAEYN